MSDSQIIGWFLFIAFFAIGLFLAHFEMALKHERWEEEYKKSKKCKFYTRPEGDNGASLMQLLDEDEEAKVNF